MQIDVRVLMANGHDQRADLRRKSRINKLCTGFFDATSKRRKRTFAGLKETAGVGNGICCTGKTEFLGCDFDAVPQFFGTAVVNFGSGGVTCSPNLG